MDKGYIELKCGCLARYDQDQGIFKNKYTIFESASCIYNRMYGRTSVHKMEISKLAEKDVLDHSEICDCRDCDGTFKATNDLADEYCDRLKIKGHPTRCITEINNARNLMPDGTKNRTILRALKKIIFG